MYQRLSLYKIAFLNILLASLLLMMPDPVYFITIKMALCLMNVCFLVVVLRNLPKFLKRNDGRLLIGRKRTLIVLLVSVYICIITFSSVYKLPINELFPLYLAWSFLLAVVYLFADPISNLLHK